ncbi:MAG: AzlD domain-containing protein [Mycobacterium sp.]
MTTTTIWLIIGTIAVGGFVLRAAFILVPVLPRNLPPRLSLVLEMVPAAAFAALVAPSLFLDGGQFRVISPSTLAGAVAILVSLRWKSLALSIVCGLIAYACFDLVL